MEEHRDFKHFFFYAIMSFISAFVVGSLFYIYEPLREIVPHRAEEEVIKDVVRADCESEVGAKAGLIRVSRQNEFALARAVCGFSEKEQAEYVVALKKVSRVWDIVYKGEQPPDQNIRERFGFPEIKEELPEETEDAVESDR